MRKTVKNIPSFMKKHMKALKRPFINTHVERMHKTISASMRRMSGRKGRKTRRKNRR